MIIIRFHITATLPITRIAGNPVLSRGTRAADGSYQLLVDFAGSNVDELEQALVGDDNIVGYWREKRDAP
jgi:hypothetical protein